MTIPTISIDGVSMPVTRGGENLLSDMPLDAVARQVLEQGAAFEVAVEQFQRAMAEIPMPANDAPAPLAPAVEQKLDPPAGRAHTPGAPLDWDNGLLARCGGNGTINDGPSATVGTPAPLAAVAQERDLPGAVQPAGEDIEAAGADPLPALESAGRRFPQAGTDPLPALEAAGRCFPQVGTDPLSAPPAETGTLPVPEAAGRRFPQVKADPLPIPQAGTDPLPVSEEERLDSKLPVLQAAPVAVAVQPQVIDVKDVAVEPVQVIAARVVHQVMATPAQVLIEAASAVADTIVVSPGLLRGMGEVQVQLRPDVLEGTVIHISAASPGALTVQFTPVTADMAVLLEKCTPQLVTYLSERIHSVQVTVNVKRDEKLKG